MRFRSGKTVKICRGNYEIHEEVPEQVRNSALFLAILSPGYLASEFCLQELEAFLEKADIGVGKRLFVVYKDEIGERPNIIPEYFRDLRKYQFWLVDSDQKPRLLGSPLPRDDSFEDRRYYYPKVGDLAADIVVKLEELREDKDRSCESNFPAVHTRSQEKRVHVLLAEVADDLEPRREDVRRYLDLAGIGCLPEGSYRLGRADFEPAFFGRYRQV